MSNVANTKEYQEKFKSYDKLFNPEFLQNKEERKLSEKYTIIICEYAGKINNLNLRGSQNILMYNKEVISQWNSIDNNADFYQIINHSNGKDYLIFRQDLYGYSVLDLETKEIMQFFPEKSLHGGETFIWTGVNYNPYSNVLAVSGCYWACPYSVHLFTFDDPMNPSQKFVDMIECFDGDYDVYDDVDFIRWEERDLRVSRYIIETNSNEEVLIKEEEYLGWIEEKGQKL